MYQYVCIIYSHICRTLVPKKHVRVRVREMLRVLQYIDAVRHQHIHVSALKHTRFSRIAYSIHMHSQCCDEGDEVLDKIEDKQSLLVCCVKHWTIE